MYYILYILYIYSIQGIGGKFIVYDMHIIYFGVPDRVYIIQLILHIDVRVAYTLYTKYNECHGKITLNQM